MSNNDLIFKCTFLHSTDGQKFKYLGMWESFLTLLGIESRYLNFVDKDAARLLFGNHSDVYMYQVIRKYERILNSRAIGAEKGEIIPPSFGRSVNPISTGGGGADFPHHVTTPPPDFQTVLKPWLDNLKFLAQ